MTITMEEDHPHVGDDAHVEELNGEVLKTKNVRNSPPSKSKSDATRSTDGSPGTSNGSDVLDESGHKNVGIEVSSNGIETATGESSPSKPKSKKKKKKKVSRNTDSVTNEQLDDKSMNGTETTTVLSTRSQMSTTSSKVKSKGTKKKKKKIVMEKDGEAVDMATEIVSVASTQNTQKSSSKKKKKKKKISKDDEDDDGSIERSTRSVTTGSVKSKPKSTKSPKSPKSTKSKKKKIKSLDNKAAIPDIQRTKSLDPYHSNNRDLKRTTSLQPGVSPNPNIKRTKSMDQSPSNDFVIKRSMSLDAHSNQYRGPPPGNAGRSNSQWSGRGRGPGGRGRGPVVGRGRGRGRGPPPGSWNGPRPQRPPERMQNGDRMMDPRSMSQERTPYGARGSSHDRMPYGNRGSSHERPYSNRGSSQDRLPYGARSPSQDRSPYGARSLSQDRLPYNNRSPSQERSSYRTNNGRGMGPAPRGRDRHIQTSPTGNVYRAPSRPKSILRNSSHHGMIPSSSHHRSIGTSSSHSSSQYNSRRVTMDPDAGSRHSRHSYKYDPHASFGSEIDSSDVESDEGDDSSFALEDSSHKRPPKTVVRGYSRSMSGLGTNSSHHGLSHFKSNHSQRSLLTIERQEYQNENRFIRALRYIHFLAPHPNEDPIKRKIRIITWIALFLDFLNALVALVTYGGETTQCCGRSIMSALGGGGQFNWDQAIFITTCLYMVLIFLEVVPVMRDAFPFNLLNPFIGFLITFAVFFSDSITEAAIMWTVEAMAVGCEVVIYRLRVQRFEKRKARLKNTKKEIEKLRKIKRKVKNQFDSGGGKILTRADSAQFVLDLDDDSSFAEDSSFFDDIETQHNSTDNQTIASRTAITTVSNIGTARETRLLRERRQLIHSQAEDERDLRYHFFGAVSNVFLVVFSLLMIVIIAKNGGMCIVGLKFQDIFASDQLAKCDQCNDINLVCEVCHPTDETLHQCYYPYGIGM